MNDAPLVELHKNLEVFISGKNRSIEYAHKIEAILIETFYEHPEFEDVLDSISRYRPEGGEYLYDEQMILPTIRQALQVVEAMLASQKTAIP